MVTACMYIKLFLRCFNSDLFPKNVTNVLTEVVPYLQIKSCDNRNFKHHNDILQCSSYVRI